MEDNHINIDFHQNSIETAYQRYEQQLRGFIERRIDTIEDAEDIAQEVWYQASRAVQFDELDNPRAWLFQVARNKIIDRYRKSKPAALSDLEYTDENGELQLDENLLATVIEPEVDLLFEQFWNALDAALDDLPESQRLVFVQNEIEDKTLREIAEETGEPLKTIISRKGYAVRKLRQSLAWLYEALD